MELMTLKQYAASKGISYEAVRKQVNRYHKELEGHVVVKNRTQFIDEWAVSFLSERRRESPVVLVTEDQQEKIAQLTDQIETLRSQLMTAQNELLSSKDRIIALQGEAQQLLEAKTNYNNLLEAHNIQEEKVHGLEADLARAAAQHEQDQNRLEELQRERDSAQAEANSFQRSLFGFYRKRT